MRRPYRRRNDARDVLLAVLQANRHTWMTTSDLAIWVYGDDRHGVLTRVCAALGHLVDRDGLTLDRRIASWSYRRNEVAWRLSAVSRRVAA